MNLQKEFTNYGVKHLGISSNTMNDVINYQVEASLTPYVLEERQMRATQMDIFSRLMMDRILWVAGVVDDRMSTVVQAQLMFLDNSEKKDITMHIDSPGGSVKSGLSMIDVMDYINCDIRTVNTGMCASMGAVLLAAGTKGKRSSLRFSDTMIHQSSAGVQGNIQDARITLSQWELHNKLLLDLLAEYTGQDRKLIEDDMHRDKWLTATQAKEYGLIDEIVKPKKKRAIEAK
jgi:ATP-dependent Clp protease protease subunit